MRKRIAKIAAGVAALAALALGGAAISQAGSTNSAKPAASPAHQAKSKHKARTRHKARAKHKATKSASTEQGNANDPADQGGSNEGSGAETNGTEQSGEETGSEVPSNDGPNGHADEPGNPNADHQFQGQE